ncbi:hypothetical protein FQN60_005586, partial [Etheostoma spectabile]
DITTGPCIKGGSRTSQTHTDPPERHYYLLVLPLFDTFVSIFRILMAICESLKAVVQRCQRKMNTKEDSDTLESHEKEGGSSRQSRIRDIERAQHAELAALLQRAERLCASQKARSNAVLERMGLSIQRDTPRSPQPPASPRRSPRCSLPGRRTRPIAEEDDRSWTSITNQMLLEDDPFLEKKLHLGSKIATLASVRRPSPDSPLSSVDTHTPTELRDISLLRSLTPTLPPRAVRRPSRIPVMKRGGAGIKLQSARNTSEDIRETVEIIQPTQRPLRARVSDQSAAPRRTLALAPKAPAPPSKSAPLIKKGPRRGTKLRAQAVAAQEDLQPFINPAEKLSLSFRQLSSDDWEKKLDGLKLVRTLAQHHPALLQTKLHEVCLVLAEEVNNLRSGVACAAMATVAKLHVHLGRALDPEAEWIGPALLLKFAQTTTAFILDQANLALDALVEGCSPGRVLTALLNIGLRGCTAQHLHQLADIMGGNQIFAAGKIFAERFLTAVSKMAVDAAPEV